MSGKQGRSGRWVASKADLAGEWQARHEGQDPRSQDTAGTKNKVSLNCLQSNNTGQRHKYQGAQSSSGKWHWTTALSRVEPHQVDGWQLMLNGGHLGGGDAVSGTLKAPVQKNNHLLDHTYIAWKKSSPCKTNTNPTGSRKKAVLENKVCSKNSKTSFTEKYCCQMMLGQGLQPVYPHRVLLCCLLNNDRWDLVRSCTPVVKLKPF